MIGCRVMVVEWGKVKCERRVYNMFMFMFLFVVWGFNLDVVLLGIFIW